MTGSNPNSDAVCFKPFEGSWLVTNPAGAIVCAKVVKGILQLPYSLDEKNLAGHYFNCRVVQNTLFCRFESFDKALAGVALLILGPNETLKGGRWLNSQISTDVQKDISRLSDTVPGMQPVVWVRRKKKFPTWAEKYFEDDDWPNKFLS